MNEWNGSVTPKQCSSSVFIFSKKFEFLWAGGGIPLKKFIVFFKNSLIYQIQTGRFNYIVYFQASAKLISFSSNLDQLRFNNLHSLSFFETTNRQGFFLKSQYHYFLDLLLHGAPNLVKLAINWNHVMHINSIFNNGHFIVAPLLNLRYLHLRHCNRPGK